MVWCRAFEKVSNKLYTIVRITESHRRLKSILSSNESTKLTSLYVLYGDVRYYSEVRRNGRIVVVGKRLKEGGRMEFCCIKFWETSVFQIKYESTWVVPRKICDFNVQNCVIYSRNKSVLFKRFSILNIKIAKSKNSAFSTRTPLPNPVYIYMKYLMNHHGILKLFYVRLLHQIWNQFFLPVWNITWTKILVGNYITFLLISGNRQTRTLYSSHHYNWLKAMQVHLTGPLLLKTV